MSQPIKAPRHEVVKKLLLNEDQHGKHYLIALTDKEFAQIAFIHKNRNSVKRVLDEFDGIGISHDNGYIQTIVTEADVINLDDMQIGGEFKYSSDILKYCKPKRTLQGTEYFWDYLFNQYDLYGSGIEEVGRFFIHLKHKVGNPNYAVIITEQC